MIVSLTYNEIVSYVKEKYNKTIELAQVDRKNIVVSCKWKPLFPEIKITLHVDSINNNIIYLSYDCNTALQIVLGDVILFLEDNIPYGIVLNVEQKRVKVYLDQIAGLQKALEHVSLSDVFFGHDSLSLVWGLA